ncbi:MAG TPA: hypothetical protein VNG90_00235 [Candidatus Acidoferrum sp.]|nr:hypothetical protein [Candidatus Acidoferrum sp.]
MAVSQVQHALTGKQFLAGLPAIPSLEMFLGFDFEPDEARFLRILGELDTARRKPYAMNRLFKDPHLACRFTPTAKASKMPTGNGWTVVCSDQPLRGVGIIIAFSPSKVQWNCFRYESDQAQFAPRQRLKEYAAAKAEAVKRRRHYLFPRLHNRPKYELPVQTKYKGLYVFNGWVHNAEGYGMYPIRIDSDALGPLHPSMHAHASWWTEKTTIQQLF